MLLTAAGTTEGLEYSSGTNGGSNGTPYRLPLYLGDWVDQVMERLFTLLSNLDTGPSHRGTDQQAKPELLLQSTHLGKVNKRHVTWIRRSMFCSSRVGVSAC